MAPRNAIKKGKNEYIPIRVCVSGKMKLSLVVGCLVSVFAVEGMIPPPPKEECPQCSENPCHFMKCGPKTECVNEPNCPCKAQCLPKKSCVGGPETGNCRAYIPSWYYDTSSGTCKEFIYGGCGGNGNRYETKKACLKKCQNKCHLLPVVGPCEAAMKRYYFNQKTQQCEIFIYGGCQGNANNFETLVDCQKSCPSGCPLCKAHPCETANCYPEKCRAKPCSCQHECY